MRYKYIELDTGHVKEVAIDVATCNVIHHLIQPSKSNVSHLLYACNKSIGLHERISGKSN